MPKRGERRTFRNKKKRVNIVKGNPPAPGERKASKKRVVLSNVNALEVPGLTNLDATTPLDASLHGTILGFPGPLVDRLRVLGAFKPTQTWNLFKRPATLIRSETIEVANLIGAEQEASTAQRLILTGGRGSGKSVLLLQAQALALLKDWIVFTIPEASDVTGARTDYGPIPDSSPILYQQKTYITQLLNRTERANPILSTLSIESRQSRSLPHAETLKTLADLCKSAEQDPEQAWAIFEALWVELTLPGRPPVLLSLDGLQHAMQHSLYRSASFELIHAHDLALINWYMHHLSGSRKLPNGGLVMAAVSSVSLGANRTLDERLAQLEAEQAFAAGTLSYDPAKDAMASYLAATEQEFSPIPAMEPHVRYDERVLNVLGRGRGLVPGSPSQTTGTKSGGKETSTKGEASSPKHAAPSTTAMVQPAIAPPHVLRCQPIDRPAARALMEYWAHSGMLRAAVTPSLVDQQWALAGGGVVGELERGVLKARVLHA